MNLAMGTRGRSHYKASLAEAGWKAGAKEGNSPVSENGFMLLVIILEYGGERQLRRNPALLLCQG